MMERLILLAVGAVIFVALAACLLGIIVVAELCRRSWRERHR